MSQDKAIGAVIISLVLMAFIFIAPGNLYSILPAEEGLSVGVVGWQDGLYGNLYSSKNIPPTVAQNKDGYALVSDDPHNFKFGYHHDFYSGVFYRWKRTDVRVEVSQPWHEKYQDISYYIDDGDRRTLIDGEVWVYHLDLDFSIVNKGIPGSGIKVFEDDPIWFSLVTNVWNRAVKDAGTGVWGKAWGAPIACYIEGYRVSEGSGDNDLIEPNQIGRFVTLYSDPSTAGARIDDLGFSLGNDLNASLAGSPSPDTRLGGPAYARWILSEFGPDTSRDLIGGITKQEYPAVNYKVKIYYLSVGKWVFTKDQSEDWSDREAEQELWGWYASLVWFWDGAFNFLGMLNPFRVFGPFAGVACLVILVGITAAILYFFTPLNFLTSLLGRARRSE